MDNIKVRLSICVPGAQMLSSQECDKNPKDSYDTVRITINAREKGKQVKKTYVSKVRKSRTVNQVINITEESYKYMVTTPPANIPHKVWSNLPRKERLKCHFDLISHDLNGISYTFDILDN